MWPSTQKYINLDYGRTSGRKGSSRWEDKRTKKPNKISFEIDIPYTGKTRLDFVKRFVNFIGKRAYSVKLLPLVGNKVTLLFTPGSPDEQNIVNKIDKKYIMNELKKFTKLHKRWMDANKTFHS